MEIAKAKTDGIEDLYRPLYDTLIDLDHPEARNIASYISVRAQIAIEAYNSLPTNIVLAAEARVWKRLVEHIIGPIE